MKKDMENYIEELLDNLTLEEKIGMIHGATLFETKAVERLGIPALKMSDGTMGVRAEHEPDRWVAAGNNDDFASYLPCTSAVASTWNRELAKKAGQVLGAEARGRGKDVILGPGMNIKRSPLCGRNFEYMSEDPEVVAEIATAMVKGIQENDVAACGKHFAANSQETDRLAVDTVVDERTLNEIYFPGFKAAVEDGDMLTIMGAYNRLNGEHCCTSKNLLNGVLRKDWGFDGAVISDWGGVHDTNEAALSSLDVEMDVTYEFDKHFLANSLIGKIKSGEIFEKCVNDKVKNILRLMYRLKMIGDKTAERKQGSYNTKEHHEAALEVARESVILLKNDAGKLPLDASRAGKIAVIGANAARMHADGGGSAEIKALYEITPLMGIRMLLGGNADVKYTPGYWIPLKERRPEISWQADSTKPVEQRAQIRRGENQDDNESMKAVCLEEAVKLAKESDTVIFVGGLDHDYDVEGLDRNDMKLPYGQDEVIRELLAVKPDMIVVMYAGSPVEMPWLSDTKSLVWSYYAGMEGGTAIAEVLFGKTNPSGKLAETFIKDEAQCPVRTGINFALNGSVTYDEGVFVGYRHYDTENTDVNFCFGHGLSYSSFKYENLKIEMTDCAATYGTGGEADDRAVLKGSFAVTNESDIAGSETVQVYVAKKDANKFDMPCHELKAFVKVKLEPKETKTLEFTLTEKDFSFYDVESKSFCMVAGEFEIQVGASSRDIRLTKKGEVKCFL